MYVNQLYMIYILIYNICMCVYIYIYIYVIANAGAGSSRPASRTRWSAWINSMHSYNKEKDYKNKKQLK